MYLFYIDETGNRDPRLKIPRKDGTEIDGDWLYVLTAVCLFERQWHGFEKTINRHKAMLIGGINARTGIKLQLADCEIKSNWVRQPKERAVRPFLANLTDTELTELVNLYYRQLDHHHMSVFAVIVDKRHLKAYMDQEKIHRKSWEKLLQTIECFMRVRHDKHQAIMVNDDVNIQMNRSLAMKHAYLLDEGTHDGTWLKHICEMPMFVRSELSNGVQLADLCGYNIYKTFKTGDMDYPFFKRIEQFIWSGATPVPRPFPGISVFPDESPLGAVRNEWDKKRASTAVRRSP